MKEHLFFGMKKFLLNSFFLLPTQKDFWRLFFWTFLHFVLFFKMMRPYKRQKMDIFDIWKMIFQFASDEFSFFGILSRVCKEWSSKLSVSLFHIEIHVQNAHYIKPWMTFAKSLTVNFEDYFPYQDEYKCQNDFYSNCSSFKSLRLLNARNVNLSCFIQCEILKLSNSYNIECPPQIRTLTTDRLGSVKLEDVMHMKKLQTVYYIFIDSADFVYAQYLPNLRNVHLALRHPIVDVTSLTKCPSLQHLALLKGVDCNLRVTGLSCLESLSSLTIELRKGISFTTVPPHLKLLILVVNSERRLRLFLNEFYKKRKNLIIYVVTCSPPNTFRKSKIDKNQIITFQECQKYYRDFLVSSKNCFMSYFLESEARKTPNIKLQ